MIPFQLTDTHYEQKLRALQALYRVIDPELAVNVLDLGLIYDMLFTENMVTVTMTLTTPHCPMGEAITAGVRNALTAEFPSQHIEVALTYEPPWHPGMISEAGKDLLGWNN
jgi:metal-sulfur cluster biosynthetic enzyme